MLVIKILIACLFLQFIPCLFAILFVHFSSFLYSSLQAVPSEGVVVVPQGGSTTIGCRVLGGGNSSLVWSRGSSARFRTGSYSVQAHTITLPTIGLGDVGYYCCSATIKLSSKQVIE